MASLRSFLPPAGSTVWRSERNSMRNSSNSLSEEHEISRTRIKHIVIREVWKRDVPTPHALYKIDVMTQSNHWFILRRYREFHALHNNLVKQYNIPSDMLPTKKFFSNMSLTHLEKRRNDLEHYIQRLINSNHDIAESKELFQFLSVQTHDVLCVTRQLAQVLENEGVGILAAGSSFTFSPTQMYCITRQLQLPHIDIKQSDLDSGEAAVDLGNLYSFIQELQTVCVTGAIGRLSPCQELVNNQAFDISLFKSLKKLQIEKCHIGVIDGLFKIQKQLTHLTLKDCLKSMKDFLIDAAVQKRACIGQHRCWIRQCLNTCENMTHHRMKVVVRPWICLTHINMSYNNITSFDHSLKLLPSLEQLDLSHNNFVHLNLDQLSLLTLTFLNLSHNQIHYISSTKNDLRNIKSLLLTGNKLANLDSLDCLRGLIELDVRSNDIDNIDEMIKISSLFHLRILATAGNPCVRSKSHRIQIFSQLKGRELILDGIKITPNEKARVNLIQKRKLSRPHEERKQNDEVMIRPCRDDDQDSGFGGNYTGGVDEGRLIFDWYCYKNIDTANFPYHAAGPSTSTCGVNATTQDNITNNQTQDDIGSTTGSLTDHSKRAVEVRISPETLSKDGKQTMTKCKSKKETCNSLPSTLLQLSLNHEARKIEDEAHTSKIY